MKRILFITVTIAAAVTVIGIVIAIGVTGHNAAVRAAAEATAVKSLITIAEQQEYYYNSHQRSSFGTFDEMLAEQLLDKRFAGTAPVVDGYVYSISVSPKTTTARAAFAVNADPLRAEGFGATGKNHFYLDSRDSTIHVNNTQSASASDPPLGQ